MSATNGTLSMVADTLTDLLDHVKHSQDELAQLKAAVRELSNNRELLHMVGPSDEEQEAAEQRCEMLEQLTDKCAWDKSHFQLTSAERNARERWEEIMDEQGVFETRYC